MKKIIKLTGCIFASIGIILLGGLVGGMLLGIFEGVTGDYFYRQFPDAWTIGTMYYSFIGIWLILLPGLYFIKKNRPILAKVGRKSEGNTLKNLGIGLLLGFAMNGFCILVAALHQDIFLEWNDFRPISFIVIFVGVFIQSSAEELVCRAYLYEKTMQYFNKPAAAVLVNSLLFAVLHLANDGVTILSVINIFLSGVMFSLMVLYMKSLWCAFAAHAAWNFTQNIIFGLPNSGVVTPYSVFKLDASTASNSFAYNVGFGIEGTVVADVVLLLVCVALWMWGRKQVRNKVS